MNNDIFDNCGPLKIFSIEKDFFPTALLTKKIFSYVLDSPFIDIGTEESYHRAQKILNSGIKYAK